MSAALDQRQRAEIHREAQKGKAEIRFPNGMIASVEITAQEVAQATSLEQLVSSKMQQLVKHMPPEFAGLKR